MAHSSRISLKPDFGVFWNLVFAHLSRIALKPDFRYFGVNWSHISLKPDSAYILISIIFLTLHDTNNTCTHETQFRIRWRWFCLLTVDGWFSSIHNIVKLWVDLYKKVSCNLVGNWSFWKCQNALHLPQWIIKKNWWPRSGRKIMLT